MQSGKSPWIGSISPSSWDVGEEDTVLSRGADSGGGSGPWAAVGHAWPGLLIDLEATTPRLSPQWMEQFGRTMRTCHAITGS